MATSKKICPVPADLASDADKLCAAMAAKFTDPATGTPYFAFTVAEGHLLAEGDAWGQKASVRPAHGSMQLFAEGWLACLKDR